MGYFVFEGNSFYEIDEECVKNRKVSQECDVMKYIEHGEERKISDSTDDFWKDISKQNENEM